MNGELGVDSEPLKTNPEEEDDDSFEVGDLSITPFLNDPMTEIHPAIGTVDDVAYVGVWIPCLVKDGKGNVSNKDMLFLITSDRKKILASDKVLEARHWRLSYKPIRFQNRWSLDSVKAFLKGEGVNALDIYHKVLGLYREFIELPEGRLSDYHSLWTIGTYFHQLFHTFPYLYVGGVKRSGKTKTLRLHSVFDFNAVFSNNMSVSSIYRIVQNSRATLLIDETEKLSNPNRALEFRNILLSGFQKGTQVFRVEKNLKDRLEPEAFEVYSPKAVANIGGLEDVLEDRCLMTFQKRSLDKRVTNQEIDIQDKRFEELRGELTKLYLLHWKDVLAIYQEIDRHNSVSEFRVDSVGVTTKPEGFEYLSSRELELWKPIFAIALFFDRLSRSTSESVFTTTQTTLTSLMLSLACSHAQQRHVENMTEVGEEILVTVLLQLVTSDFSWVKVKRIKDQMNTKFDEPQEWITPKWIGSALRRLGFTDKRRLGSGVEYNVSRAVLKDLGQRMQIQELEEASNESAPLLPEATTCPICLRFLPEDHRDTTVWESKEVHTSCYRKLKEGLRDEG